MKINKNTCTELPKFTVLEIDVKMDWQNPLDPRPAPSPNQGLEKWRVGIEQIAFISGGGAPAPLQTPAFT